MYILIRIPRLPDVAENSAAPRLMAILSMPQPESYFPLKDLELPPVPWCEDCKGKGVNVQCPECQGMGEVCFDNSYNSYTFDCKSCDGEGVKQKCETCGETGKHEGMVGISYANSFFQVRYLRLLKELPGCELGTPPDCMSPAWFRFEGGDGLIMPMRK
jgi:hypothetical protein